MDACGRGFVSLALYALVSVSSLAQTIPPIQPSVWAERPDAAAFEKTESAKLAAAQSAIDALLLVKGARTIENTLEPFDEANLQLENAYWFAMLIQEAYPDTAFRDKGSALVGVRRDKPA